MAEPTSAAAAAAPLPVPSAIERAEAFTRERFVHDGEDAATALAPGSARRRALDAALAELDRGATAPSTRWRRRYALLLGLERLLSQDDPTLADGTTLNPHQVDALSGTLTALLAARPERPCDDDRALGPGPGPGRRRGAGGRRPGRRRGGRAGPRPRPRRGGRGGRGGRVPGADDELAEAPSTRTTTREEDDVDEVDEDVAEGAADDPNAHKRFWFEHATGAGKTVAAMGFVEASRTGGDPDPHPPPQPRRPVPGRAARPRLRRPRVAAAAGGRRHRAHRRAGHRRDLPVVRAQRGPDLRRLHDRHLRRGAHRARREDVAPRSARGRARSSSA